MHRGGDPRLARRDGKCPTWSLMRKPGASTGRRSMPTSHSAISSSRGLRPAAAGATYPFRECRCLTRAGASSAIAASGGTLPSASKRKQRCERARSAFAHSCNSPSTCTGRLMRSIALSATSSPETSRRRRAWRLVRRPGNCPTWSLTQRPGAGTGRRLTPTCRSAISSSRSLAATAASATCPSRECRCLTRTGAS